MDAHDNEKDNGAPEVNHNINSEEFAKEDENIPKENEPIQDETEITENDLKSAEDEMIEDLSLENIEELKDDSVEGFFGHSDSVYCVRFNPINQSMVVSGGGDEVGFLWNCEDGETPLAKLEGHSDSVSSCSYSFDGKYIATGSMDSTIRIFEGSSGVFIHSLEGPSSDIEWIKWHPKGPVLLVGCADGTCWMFNAVNAECLHVFSGHRGSVTCGGFNSSGKYAITCSEDASCYIWNAKTGQAKHQLKGGNYFHSEQINCMDCHSSKALLLTGSHDKTARLTHIKSGKNLLSVKIHESPIEGVAFSNSEQSWFSVCSIDGLISIWDTNLGHCRSRFSVKDGIIRMMWHPTQPFIICSGLDGQMLLVDGRSGKVEKLWHGHVGSILDFDLSRDGNTIVTAGNDSSCLVFKLN
uniref:WD repeat protein n=1 Tax=Hirondellea gigas TaxID=1518452 RepID=A0A6A7GBE2_9CRUS